MTTRMWLSATLAVCIIAIAPSSSAEDFSIDLTRIYYQDGSGREIDYDFSTGSVDGQGIIAIPPAAILQRPTEEAGTAYGWGPVYGDISCVLGVGAARMSIPQADITIPPIPSATIAVDGDPADWAAVGPYVQDTNTLEDDVSQPGTDIEYVKLAYSPDGTLLNILFKVTDAVSQGVWYRMFFTLDPDNMDSPGNYQVDFNYRDGAWRVDGQGWYSEDNWYWIDPLGQVAASGAFIEGTIDVGALGLGNEFFFFGRTMQSESPYARYDYFRASEFDQEGLYGLGPNPGDPTAAATGDCTFEATITNFQNVSREQYYFDVDVGLGGWESGPQPALWALWFTGMHEGIHYENVLVLGAMVENESTGEEWESAEIFLEELNPSTTTVDLKVEITGGTTFSASYRVNDGAGPWQPLWQHTITQGQMRGIPELFPYVYMETGYEPIPDITEIGIDQFKDYQDGSPLAAPYGIEIFVEGTGLGEVTVEDPYGVVHTLVQYGPGEWDFEDYGYADLTALEAVYGSGEYIFTFNGGADTVTLNYAVAEPAGFADITYPAHNQLDVESNPEYTWNTAAAFGEALGMWIVQNPEGMGSDIYEEWNADINQTSWQPGPLVLDEDYEFELSVINFHGGAPQNAATVGDDDFTYEGAFEYINIIEFHAPATGPALDVTTINIGEDVDYLDGSLMGTNPFEFWVEVIGEGIQDVTVEDPHGGVHALVWHGGEGSWAFSDPHQAFATREAMEAAYGPGNYIFTFNGEADAVTALYDPVAPGGLVNITDPTQNQSNVGADPLYTWDPAGALGDGLYVEVNNLDAPPETDGVVYSEILGIGETSWQPGPLQAATNYGLQVGVYTAGGAPTQTVNEDPFNLQIHSERSNHVHFATAPMPDIEEILIGTFRDYVDGVQEPIRYQFEIEVTGTGISDVSVQVPNGGVHTLISHDGGGWWSLEQGFASLTALRDVFGTGDYIFTFNGGFDSVTINYDNVAEPTDFADITSPEHGEHSVDLNPTLEWESAVGYGDFLGMWFIEDPEDAETYLYEAVPVDIATVSWQPSTLSDQTEYEFELAVVNGSLDATTTDQDDAFFRTTVFAYINIIRFDTLHWKIPGDINGDCKVNIVDMIWIRNKLNADTTSGDNWWADVNSDGLINIVDMVYVRNKLNDTCDE